MFFLNPIPVPPQRPRLTPYAVAKFSATVVSVITVKYNYSVVTISTMSTHIDYMLPKPSIDIF